MFKLAAAATMLMLASPAWAQRPHSDGADYTFRVFDVPGGTGTRANGINNRGQIVGDVGSATGSHGFLLDGGRFTIIDLPAGQALDRTSFNGINDRSQIVGFSEGQGEPGFGNGFGFVDTNGSFTTIFVPGSSVTAALGINNRGQIVGTFTLNTPRSGFLLSGGRFTTIVVPGAIFTSPNAISNNGEIVGDFVRTLSSNFEGFVLRGGNFVVVDVPGAKLTSAQGVNASGQVVGVFTDSRGKHGFVETRGEFVSIDVPGAVVSGVTTTDAAGINNGGVVVGSFQDGTGVHGFVATPTR